MDKPQHIVGGENFASKEALATRVKKLLWSYKPGERLSPVDQMFIAELLKRHPGYEQKKGSGIDYIHVRSNPVFKNTQGFWLVRIDGTETDFSYKECITPTKNNKIRVRAACRTAIEQSVLRVKKAFFHGRTEIAVCPFTGEILTWDNSHVDHAMPKTFQFLLDSFLKETGLDIEAIKVVGEGIDNAIVDIFEDKKLECRWIDYHDKHADLRIISATANLGVARKTKETNG